MKPPTLIIKDIYKDIPLVDRRAILARAIVRIIRSGQRPPRP